jgi:hypothetical protein
MAVNIAQIIDTVRKLLGLAHRGAVLIEAATSAFDKVVVEAQKGLDAIAATKAANQLRVDAAFQKYVAAGAAAVSEANALATHEAEAQKLIDGVNKLLGR